MATTLELPLKSTRFMSEAEVRAEAARFGIAPDDDVDALRRSLRDELARRWRDENRDTIAAMNAWVEKNGLPLEKLRCW